MSVRNKNQHPNARSFWKLCASDAWKESVEFAFHSRDPRWSFLSTTTSFFLSLFGLYLIGAPLDFGERLVVSLAIAGSQLMTLVVAFVKNLWRAPFERWAKLHKENTKPKKRRTAPR
jgi:hypothetical protein